MKDGFFSPDDPASAGHMIQELREGRGAVIWLDITEVEDGHKFHYTKKDVIAVQQLAWTLPKGHWLKVVHFPGFI